MNASSPSFGAPVIDLSLQRRFLALLPRIERHARIYFRHVTCPVQKADCLAETVALCWKWFLRLAERGKDARPFVTVLAAFATRAVRSGRRLCGQMKAQDVLNPIAQQRHGFRVESLPISTRVEWERLYGIVGGQRLTDSVEERLHDNTQTPIPDQVAFRIDFPSWLTTRTERDRRLIERMGLGERTNHLSHQFSISPGRVSQLRREFHDDWNRFCES